jgi:hypothetical protein
VTPSLSARSKISPQKEENEDSFHEFLSILKKVNKLKQTDSEIKEDMLETVGYLLSDTFKGDIPNQKH